MGEYARFRGQSVKIGTCEDMYYLRAADRFQVQHERGNVDAVSGVGLRFRFPWPDEDAFAAPGVDDPSHRFDRSVCIPGMAPTSDVEHYSVQFKADAGYLVSIPCPEGQRGATQGFTTTVDGLTVHRNGFRGSVHLCQQKLLADGRLVPVLKCGGCGSKWRLETPADIEELADTIARRDPQDSQAAWWATVCHRIMDGAGLALTATEGR